jgi:biofilm PGA synthesis N-glycosyltransferase PgaC
MEYLLLISIGLLFYIYAGYPLLLALLAVGRRGHQSAKRDDVAPAVSLFIPAHNEARVIAGKVSNSIEQIYPPQSLEIVVVSDASTDGTSSIAAGAGGQRVSVHQSPVRMGKSALINRYTPMCHGDILVFTDANAMFRPDAISLLVRHFADQRVGCVVGNLRYIDQVTAVARGEGLYFRYESLLKTLESRLGTVVAATGSIYAIRRDLIAEFSPDVANDFAHPIQTAAAGFKVVFEPDAIAFERATSQVDEEFSRKTRIVTRGMTAFARYWSEGRMLQGLWGFCFVSHKLLRWFGWVYALVAFGTTIALASEHELYRLLLVGQIAFYGIALLGWFAGSRRGKLLAVPFYFCMINAAALVGAVRFVGGRRMAIWESAPTTR